MHRAISPFHKKLSFYLFMQHAEGRTSFMSSWAEPNNINAVYCATASIDKSFTNEAEEINSVWKSLLCSHFRLHQTALPNELFFPTGIVAHAFLLPQPKWLLLCEITTYIRLSPTMLSNKNQRGFLNIDNWSVGHCQWIYIFFSLMYLVPYIVLHSILKIQMYYYVLLIHPTTWQWYTYI
jgi:hypothetical protein